MTVAGGINGSAGASRKSASVSIDEDGLEVMHFEVDTSKDTVRSAQLVSDDNESRT